VAEPTSDIILRAQHGDPEALGLLIVGQQQYIYNIAMSVLRQPEDAADLTQDACMKLIRVIGQYNGESRFTTWLYRLVVNLGRDELRRRGRRVLSLPPLTDEDGATLSAGQPGRRRPLDRPGRGRHQQRAAPRDQPRPR
jgi:RNA polymerase sigma-70 factor (ECF subfamily)